MVGRTEVDTVVEAEATVRIGREDGESANAFTTD